MKNNCDTLHILPVSIPPITFILKYSPPPTPFHFLSISIIPLTLFSSHCSPLPTHFLLCSPHIHPYSPIFRFPSSSYLSHNLLHFKLLALYFSFSPLPQLPSFFLFPSSHSLSHYDLASSFSLLLSLDYLFFYLPTLSISTTTTTTKLSPYQSLSPSFHISFSSFFFSLLTYINTQLMILI